MQIVLLMIGAWLTGLITLLAWIWWVNRPIDKSIKRWEKHK